jgi:photosystem II stability/assembly factor-like uncharacterized protein
MSLRTFLLALLVSSVAFDSHGAARRRAVEHPSTGEWKLVRGITGPQAVACTPDTLLVGTASGVFKVADMGVLPAGLNGVSVEGLTLAPNGTSFAIAASGAVHRSTDGGGTWQRLANTPPSVTVLTATFDSLYAGGCDGLFASSDQRETWVSSDKGLPGASTRSRPSARGSTPEPKPVFFARSPARAGRGFR